MIIDSHCHLLSNEYENVDDVIKSNLKEVDKIIINGYDLESSKEAVSLACKYENVYAAVGIGPENIDNVNEKCIDEIKKLALNNKVVAIGEIGLDYYWTKETKKQQIAIFNEMLQIAKENKLPVIVHSRSAIKDTYDNICKYNVVGTMHCYSGSKEMAIEFIKKGFLIGVGGVVTFKNAKEIKEVVDAIELKDIALETDSPYLSPEPLRGKLNEPKNLRYIIEKVADIKGKTTAEVISVTGSSVSTKFDLDR